jgi:hypothetical protein
MIYPLKQIHKWIPIGFLKMGMPKTMGFSTQMVYNLDDLGIPAF